MDVEKTDLENISHDNPLKLVFKMAKTLLVTKPNDEDIYKAKIQLAEELIEYDKVKNEEQIEALADFLEYLFLIEDNELEQKFEEKAIEKGEYKKAVEVAKNLLDVLDDETITLKTGLDIEEARKFK